jgi:lysophospholipase L1-like esterase
MTTGRRSDRTVVALLLALAAVLAACSQSTESSAQPPSPTPASPEPASAAPSVPTQAPTAEASASVGTSVGVYLAIGDSITFGIGVPRPLEEGYVARVRDALATDPSPAIPIGETRVFAVPGETASGFLDRRLDAVLQAVADGGARVELVTIGLGANELLRARRDPTCEADRGSPACRAIVDAAVAAAIDALDRIVGSVLAALAAAGSDARVLLLAYYNPDPDPLTEATVAGPDSTVACTTVDPGLDDRIACVADERGIGIVDLHAAFRGRELELTRFGSGDVHPNAAGYAVIADAILARLEAAP